MFAKIGSIVFVVFLAQLGDSALLTDVTSLSKRGFGSPSRDSWEQRGSNDNGSGDIYNKGAPWNSISGDFNSNSHNDYGNSRSGEFNNNAHSGYPWNFNPDENNNAHNDYPWHSRK